MWSSEVTKTFRETGALARAFVEWMTSDFPERVPAVVVGVDEEVGGSRRGTNRHVQGAHVRRAVHLDVLEEMSVVPQLGLEAVHRPGRAHQRGRQHGEVADVGPDVDERVAGLKDRADEVGRFRFIELPRAEVVQHEALAHLLGVEEEPELTRSRGGREVDADFLAHG